MQGEAAANVESISRVDEGNYQAAIELTGDEYVISESGSYELTGEGTTSISIVGKIQVALRLIDVNIDTGLDRSAINIGEGADVSIIVQGQCKLNGRNGIHVPGYTTLDLSGATGKDGTDMLTATATVGSHNGCGIGHYADDSNSDGADSRLADAGNIKIHDIAYVVASGAAKNNDEGGAGIGGGRCVDAKQGKVTIENVKSLVAVGASKGAAIGGGFWRGVDVSIKDCSFVSATGGFSAAGIGTSRNATEGDRYDDKNPALISTIDIVNSTIVAEGGQYGAGIGSGYQDLSIGDYSRVNNDYRNFEDTRPVFISITGTSNVIATGGQLGAGIGGGYKDYSQNIFIGKDAVVTAYAGAKGSGGAKVACAIGSGADGSGIFSDVKGTIVIEDGAVVRAFGYGYEAIDQNAASSYTGEGTLGGNKGVLGSKWAISRELASSSTAPVAVLRFLNNDNVLHEGIEDMGFYGVDGKQFVFHSLTTNVDYRLDVKKGYGSIALSLPKGTYTVYIDGQENALFSFLLTEGYSAVANGELTGSAKQVYGAQVGEGSYANYDYKYYTYNKGGSDTATIHYAFGTYDAGFTVGNGLTFFDAVAIRPNAPITIPQDSDDPEDPTTPETPATPATPDTPITPQSVTPDAPATPAPAPEAGTPVVEIAGDAVPLAAAGVVAPVATAAATPVAEAIADDAVPMAEGESIADDTTPLAGFYDEEEECWVHWWILLGILLTAAYSSVVIGRRSRHSHKLKKMDDDVMNGDSEEENVEAPASVNLGAQPAMSTSAEK